MPLIQVTMLKGRTPEQKKALIRELTEAAVSSIDANPESIRVVLYEVDGDHFAVAGETMTERKARNTK